MGELSYSSGVADRMPGLSVGTAIDEGFALDLAIACDTLFSGDEVDGLKVMWGLLDGQETRSCIQTILALLARVLIVLEGDSGVGGVTRGVEMLVSHMDPYEAARARELITIVLNDGVLSAGAAERTSHQAGSDGILLAEILLLASAMLSAGEGESPGTTLRTVAAW
jgi:hypothetical protein